MVEYAVQHHADSVFVQCRDNRAEVLVCAEPAVDFFVIAGVIAVCVRFKDRREIDRIAAECFDVRDPVRHLPDPADLVPVILKRRAAETERIDLIKYRVIAPSMHDTRSFPADMPVCIIPYG